MIKFNLIVDERAIASYLLKHRKNQELKDELYLKRFCRLLNNYENEKCVPLYNQLKKNMDETINYKEEIQLFYDKNYDFLKDYFENYLRIDKDRSIDVFILPPGINDGRTNSDKAFFWGHELGLTDKNYNLVYMFHESLHCLYSSMDFPGRNYDVIHALIELASDCELYTKLNEQENMLFTPRKKYKELYSLEGNFYKIGHNVLKEVKEMLMPLWISYLGLSESEIRKRKLESYDRYSKDLSDFDFDKLIEHSFEFYNQKKASEITEFKTNNKRFGEQNFVKYFYWHMEEFVLALEKSMNMDSYFVNEEILKSFSTMRSNDFCKTSKLYFNPMTKEISENGFLVTQHKNIKSILNATKVIEKIPYYLCQTKMNRIKTISEVLTLMPKLIDLPDYHVDQIVREIRPLLDESNITLKELVSLAKVDEKLITKIHEKSKRVKEIDIFFNEMLIFSSLNNPEFLKVIKEIEQSDSTTKNHKYELLDSCLEALHISAIDKKSHRDFKNNKHVLFNENFLKMLLSDNQLVAEEAKREYEYFANLSYNSKNKSGMRAMLTSARYEKCLNTDLTLMQERFDNLTNRDNSHNLTKTL